LYVETKDIKALVSGAVSLVKAGEEGSRIAAIGGEIRVQEGTMERSCGLVNRSQPVHSWSWFR
jgi:hypothetical protein